MKAYGGMYVKGHIFLTSVLVGSEWSASRLGRYTPQAKEPPVRLGGPQSCSGQCGEEDS
jgi:hypothetical protein